MAIDWSTKLAAHLSLDAAATATWGELLAQIGRGVQGAIERTLSRKLEPADYIEAYDGRGLETLYLRNDPVISVSRVSVLGTDLTIGDPALPTYPPEQVIIEDEVCLTRTDGLVFPKGPASTIVTYRAGYAVPPPAVLEMGILWAALIFKNRDRAGISSQSMGSQTVTFTDEAPPFVKRGLVSFARVAGRS